MSNQLQEDGSFINSIVGERTSFRGELELNGLLRIDGDFSGTIRTDGKVLVGINGRAECTINAGTVVIGGVVKGDIHAGEKVLILSTGMMIGNINTPRLIAEEGVVLNGSCLVMREPTERNSATAKTVVGDSVVGDTDRLLSDSDSRNAPEANARGILDSPEEPAAEKTEDADEEKVYSGAPEGDLGSWDA